MNDDIRAVAELFLEFHPFAKDRDPMEWLQSAFIWAYQLMLCNKREMMYLFDTSGLPEKKKNYSSLDYVQWCYRMKQEGHWQ